MSKQHSHYAEVPRSLLKDSLPPFWNIVGHSGSTEAPANPILPNGLQIQVLPILCTNYFLVQCMIHWSVPSKRGIL
jgi:hypothetical protein